MKICSSLPIQTIYHERVRVNKILQKISKKEIDNIKFSYINNPKIKSICNKNELIYYLNYLDEQLYIYPKNAILPESIKDKIYF
jgi:hypothetical protein